jgi:hypothetical protein
MDQAAHNIERIKRRLGAQANEEGSLCDHQESALAQTADDDTDPDGLESGDTESESGEEENIDKPPDGHFGKKSGSEQRIPSQQRMPSISALPLHCSPFSDTMTDWAAIALLSKTPLLENRHEAIIMHFPLFTSIWPGSHVICSRNMEELNGA